MCEDKLDDFLAQSQQAQAHWRYVDQEVYPSFLLIHNTYKKHWRTGGAAIQGFVLSKIIIIVGG